MTVGEVVRMRIIELCQEREISFNKLSSISGVTLEHIANQYIEPDFDYKAWENSEYLPTPTIVEAAQALYRGHNVHDITRSDAGAENLTVTTSEINRIIEHSKTNNRK